MIDENLKAIGRWIEQTKKYNAETYDTDSKIEKFIKHAFSRSIQYLRKERRRTFDSRRLDLDGAWLKRRYRATSSMLKIVEAQYSGKYSKVNIPKLIISLCSGTHRTYDSLNKDNDIIYAAAIWILDRLKVNGKLEEAFSYYPDHYIDNDDVLMPRVNDLEHDTDVIRNMMYVIQNRHRGLNKETQADKCRFILDEFNASGRNAQNSTTDLDNYNAILDLIPEKDRKEAADNFKAVCLKFIDVFLEGLETCENKNQELFLALEDSYKNVLFAMENNAPINLSNTMAPFSSVNNTNMVDMLHEEMARERMSDYIDKYNSYATMIDDYFNDFWSAYETEDQSITTDESGELLKKVKDIDIGDLFAHCFALMYLADQDDDFIWAYGASSFIMEDVLNMLPWAFLSDSADSQYLISKNNLFGIGYKCTHENYGEKESFDWYKIKSSMRMFFPDDYLDANFKAAAPLAMFRTSYSSLIYFLTGFLMPRIHRDYGLVPERLEREGINKDSIKLICSYIDMMHALATKSRWLDVRGINEEEVEIKKVPDDDTNNASNEALIKEILKLKEENKLLRHEAYSSNKRLEILADKDENREKETKSLISELTDLREIVFRINNQDIPEEDNQETPVVFPYTVNHAVTVFGGHDTWSKAIKPLLKNVRFVNRNVVPNADLIKNADAVWIQTNCIGHSFYWKIIELAKHYGVKIRYFTSSSAERCATQIVRFDELL